LSQLKIWKTGSKGPQVELIQLALMRQQLLPEKPDGIFGSKTENAVRRFQKENAIKVDGIVGKQTWQKLTPYLTGFTQYTIQSGDTYYKLAEKFHTTIQKIEIANPGRNPLNLSVGSSIVIPYAFPVVSSEISCTSVALQFFLNGLTARYPFLVNTIIGKSVMGSPLSCIQIGTGKTKVFYNGSHHANEWIVTPVILQFLEEYAEIYAKKGMLQNIPANTIYQAVSLYVVPMVNPDGVDLVTKELTDGFYYNRAKGYSEQYPQISFPFGWKANINGIDLNLQYPAGWINARQIKFAQGYVSPAPRDYVGSAPLITPENQAIAKLTDENEFSLTLSYHTQGEIIYWKYLDYLPPKSREIGKLFERESGYTLEETPLSSGYAGYKDWFIETRNRPGYTIEAGIGNSPLPLSQFDSIYRKNLGILQSGLTIWVS